MVEGVDAGLAVVEMGRRDPFGVAVGVFRVVQPPGLISRWWDPQAKARLSMLVVRHVAYSSMWCTSHR